MTDADKADFVKTLIGLAAVKPSKGLTAEALEIWWASMHERWELVEFKSAASHLARTVEFMPSPFHFEQLRRAGQQTAGEAFADVLRWVRAGAHRTRIGMLPPEPSEVAQRAVAALGGFGVIGMTDEEKLGFLERRFAEHYEAMVDAAAVRECLPQIAGHRRAALKGPQIIRGLLTEAP